MLQETHDREEIIERVAALDIGKAELVCCVRVPDEGSLTRARAIARRRFIPPDRVSTRLSERSPSWTKSSRLVARS